MTFLHLNVRGLCSGTKDDTIRNLLSKLGVNMVGLTKTKLREVDLNRVSLLRGRTYFKYFAVEASENGSGGSLLFWNPDFF